MRHVHQEAEPGFSALQVLTHIIVEEPGTHLFVDGDARRR